MNEANDAMADWQALARQSWDSWAEFARRAGTPKGAASTADADTASATVERMLGGLKAWLQWMQSAASTDFSADNWQASLRQMFERAGQPFAQAFAGIDGVGAQGFEGMMRQWSDAWRNPGGQPRDWLDMPTFGHARGQQQLQQQLAVALLECAEPLRRYQALIARAHLDGIDRLQAKLAAHAEPGRQIQSLRALYDLWVDAAEEAYAEVALSAEFREAYGALVNAQMRVRSLQRQQLEQLATQLGMPTRSETDSLGKRLQELRRQVRAVDVSALVEEVAALRIEVESLRKMAASTATPAARKRAGADVPRKKNAPPKAAPRRSPAGPAGGRKSAGGKAKPKR